MPTLKPNGKRLNGTGSRWIQPWRRLAVYLRDGMRCQYCTKDLTHSPARDITLDHVTPQCQGGTHHESNLILACLNCNSRRQHLPVHVFVRLMADALYQLAEGTLDPEYLDGLRNDIYTTTLARIHRTRRHSLRKHADTARAILASKTHPAEVHTHCAKEM